LLEIVIGCTVGDTADDDGECDDGTGEGTEDSTDKVENWTSTPITGENDHD
jgi:hypothetical protein